MRILPEDVLFSRPRVLQGKGERGVTLSFQQQGDEVRIPLTPESAVDLMQSLQTWHATEQTLGVA